MKAVSGKFHPIFQWFYFDAVEALPEGLPLPAAEVAAKARVSMHLLSQLLSWAVQLRVSQ
jgi:hypothetical protein